MRRGSDKTLVRIRTSGSYGRPTSRMRRSQHVHTTYSRGSTCESCRVRTLLNLLWLVLAGFWLFLAYLLVGALWCITVVGIPFGVASFRVGRYALWPFGRELVKKPGAGVASGVGNLFWFLLAGVWLAIGHAVTGVLLCLTIIGIPLGVANFKLVPVALLPLGREIVTSRDVTAAFAPVSS